MGCATALFWGRPPGAQGRVQRSTIIFEKSISKIFILNFMFVLKNKRMRFSLCRLGRTPGVGLGVAWGHFSDVSEFGDCCSIAHLASLLHQ